MVLLSDVLKGSVVALGALLTLLTAPTTLHIPLRNAAVRGATRLRVLLGAAYTDRVAERLVDAGPASPPATPGAMGAQASVKSAADAVEPVEEKSSVPRGEAEVTEPQTSASPDMIMRGATQLPVLLGATNADRVREQLVDSVATPSALPGSTEVLASVKSAANAVEPIEVKASVPQDKTEVTALQKSASPDEIMHEATRLPVLLGAINADWVPDQPAKCVAIFPVPPDTMEGHTSMESAADIVTVLGPIEGKVSVSLGTAEVADAIEATELQRPASLDVSEVIGFGPHASASLEAEEAVIAPRIAEGTSQVPLMDSTSKAVTVVLQAAPSHARPPRLHVPLPGAITVQSARGPSTGPPVNIWVIMSFVGPVVAITGVLLRCRIGNKRRTRRLATLDSSVPSIVAADEVEQDGIDNNASTTRLQQRCEHVEGEAPIFLDLTFPSPTLRFVPVMENAPDLDETSQSSEDSDETIRPSVPSITITLPRTELPTSVQTAPMTDSDDVIARPLVIIPDNTGEAAEAGEGLRVSHTPSPRPLTATTSARPYNGVRYLIVSHIRFDSYVWPTEDTAGLAEGSHPRSSTTPESSVTESRGLVRLDTSNEVEPAQGATRDTSSTPPDTGRTSTSSDSNKASPVVLPNGAVAPSIETSGATSAVGVDVPLESDAATDEDLDLTPRLPSVATGVAQEGQPRDGGPVVSIVDGPAQVATHTGGTEVSEIYHCQTEQQSMASMDAYRFGRSVGHLPELTGLGIQTGDQQVKCQAYQQGSPLASSSQLSFCAQVMTEYSEPLENSNQRPPVLPSKLTAKRASGQSPKPKPSAVSQTTSSTETLDDNHETSRLIGWQPPVSVPETPADYSKINPMDKRSKSNCVSRVYVLRLRTPSTL